MYHVCLKTLAPIDWRVICVGPFIPTGNALCHCDVRYESPNFSENHEFRVQGLGHGYLVAAFSRSRVKGLLIQSQINMRIVLPFETSWYLKTDLVNINRSQTDISLLKRFTLQRQPCTKTRKSLYDTSRRTHCSPWVYSITRLATRPPSVTHLSTCFNVSHHFVLYLKKM